MADYFRITAYHPQKDICAIFDSNGKFDAIWQFSSLLVQKGFKLIAIGDDRKFLGGDLAKVEISRDKIFLRACAKGMPRKDGNHIGVNGRGYVVNI